MSNIITAVEAKSLKDIGEKIDIKKIDSVIEQAQIVDLKGAFGDRFFFDLVGNLNNPLYQDLLSGSTFAYFGVNYHQDGIKALLADYFMARYVLQINTNFTPFGATVKQSNDSEPADRNSLKDISTQQLQMAGARLEIIKLYLTANASTFPQWNNNIYGDETAANAGERTFRFRKI
jgi:hypothetical protein